MLTRTRKVGRPVGFYRMANGDRVDGLIRLKDGRWRVCQGKVTFTEASEERAVRRAMDIMERQKNVNQTTMVKVATYPDEQAALKGFKTILDGEDVYTFNVPDDGKGPITLEKSYDTAEVWAYLAETILNNPEYAAKRSGIASLAWLPDIKKPAPSPTLDEVGKFYTGRTDIGEKECTKCGTTWKDFSRTLGVDTLRDVTPELVAQWGSIVKKRGLSAKSIHHAFNRVKTILNYFRQTGRSIDDIRHALDCCAVLKAPETTSLDPHPISRADLHKLLAGADEQFKTMLLVALNLALYPVDVARLKWAEFDLERGVYSCKRGKTKVARIATLWSRTMAALKSLSRSSDDELIFHKTSGQPHTDTTIRKAFWDLRETAGVAKTVQFADLRDGSFTAAVQGEGVEFQHARMLAGHRSGVADNYVLRNPKMVAKACAAVEDFYFTS